MDNVQERKENPVIGYFKGAYHEMRKVSWPTRQETWRKAWIVIGFSIAFAIFLGGMDYLLNLLVETVL
jgi:preprotein translocase subunit SecE